MRPARWSSTSSAERCCWGRLIAAASTPQVGDGDEGARAVPPAAHSGPMTPGSTATPPPPGHVLRQVDPSFPSMICGTSRMTSRRRSAGRHGPDPGDRHGNQPIRTWSAIDTRAPSLVVIPWDTIASARSGTRARRFDTRVAVPRRRTPASVPPFASPDQLELGRSLEHVGCADREAVDHPRGERRHVVGRAGVERERGPARRRGRHPLREHVRVLQHGGTRLADRNGYGSRPTPRPAEARSGAPRRAARRPTGR